MSGAGQRALEPKLVARYAERMEPTDLTVRILQEIRDDVRGLREEQRATREEQRATREELHGTREELRTFIELATARFEVLETTQRDLAQQLVVLGRGVKVAIEQRSKTDERLDDHERRLADLERRAG